MHLNSNDLCKRVALRAMGLLGLSAWLAGCSLVYEDARYANIRACEKLPNMEERNACVRKNQTLFDEYEKQRQKTMIGPNEARESQQDALLSGTFWTLADKCLSAMEKLG